MSDEKVTIIYGGSPNSGAIIEYKGMSLVCVRPGHPKYDAVWVVLEESLGLKCGTCGGPLTQGPAGRTEKRCYNAACIAQRSQPARSGAVKSDWLDGLLLLACGIMGAAVVTAAAIVVSVGLQAVREARFGG